MTLFEMKEHMHSLEAEIKSLSDWIGSSAADPNVAMEEIEKKQEKRLELEKRLEITKHGHDEEQKKQRDAVAVQTVYGANMDDKAIKVKSKAEFFRTVMTTSDKESIKKAYQGLGGIPALDGDLGNGSNLIPTNLQNELITEPIVENPMRSIARVSNIRGLEEPKLLFDLDGSYDDITDKDTAKEIEMDGGLVTYGRHKVKVRAKVSDTIVYGSDLPLVSEIENALRSGLAANEMFRMFAPTPAADYAGMSFYSTVNAVKTVTGDTKQAAIAKALADLPIMFRRNAKIVMNAVDWYEMWSANLNKSGTFNPDMPPMLFGKQVVLVDDATDPIVGDFNYCRINYDIDTTYDADKDVDSGFFKFVLTAWYDIKLRLSSAFRIAKSVNP